jgi:hypothetical protein
VPRVADSPSRTDAAAPGWHEGCGAAVQHEDNQHSVAVRPHSASSCVARSHTVQRYDRRLHARVSCEERANVKRTAAIGFLGLFSLFGASTALAQQPAPVAAPALAQQPATTPGMAQQAAPTFVTVPMPDASAKQVYAVGVTEPKPVPKQFAFTFNPINLLIGRYAFNFEYQPLPHHGLIVTPHFDHATSTPLQDGDPPISDTLTGFGAEFGYRFYSGTQGFNGFFAGPSLLIARYSVTDKYRVTDTYSRNDTSYAFSSVGAAIDIGAQWQLGHFIIGGSVGVQYLFVNRMIDDDFVLRLRVGETDGGGGPRLAFNLGYAF